MNRIEIKGIIPPIITPMHADESINTAELRRQVDRQIENGVHALFCFGTNGEGYILDGREKQLVLETVIEQTNGRVPVYAAQAAFPHGRPLHSPAWPETRERMY